MAHVLARRGVVWLAVLVVAVTACQPASSASPFRLSFPPTASPSGSGAPSPVAPSASPAQEAIEAFVDRVSAGDFSYVASIKGGSRHSVTILPIKGSLSVSGANYALSSTFTFPDQHVTAKVEHRYVKRVAWVRVTGTAWRRLGAFGQDDVMSPFAEVLTPADVKLVSQVKGASRYHIEMPAMIIHPSLIPAVNLTAEQVQRTRLDVVIDQQGRPISANWELRGSGRVSGQLQEVVIELDLKFSKVGGKVTVRAP